MGKQRKTWSIEEKLSLVLETLSGDKSLAEIARGHGVHENQLYRWRGQFLELGRQGLSGSKGQTVDQSLRAENDQLKRLLGEKALELEVLKKMAQF